MDPPPLEVPVILVADVDGLIAPMSSAGSMHTDLPKGKVCQSSIL